jgi:hypothetical protein
MDRAGLTPAYAVEVRHKDDHAQQQANEQAFRDPVEMARELLDAVPLALNLLPPDEVRTVLDQLPQHLR